jgi:succinyl-diaminopimelate desuccinylase
MECDTDSEVVNLLQELVCIETENPPGNERECAEFIADWFAERSIDCEFIHEPYKDRPQVVARIGALNTDSPTLVLNGHMDVVPAGEHDRWEHNPYGAEIENGHLYGRGAADMKAGLAVGMVTAARLQKAVESGDLAGSILVHAAVDEERVGPGTKALVEQGYTGDYGVVLEPTGLRTATAEKGHIWYTITVKGEPAHGSQPHEGRNAIEGAYHVIDALVDYDERVRERENDLLGSAYASITQFNAGTKENIIPERATLTLDRRFIPEEDSETIDHEIEELLAKVASEYQIEIVWEHVDIVADASQVPADCTVARALRERSQMVANVNPNPWGFPATSDLRNLVNNADMEAVTWGPGEVDQAHTTDERVTLDQVEDAVEVLTGVADDLLPSKQTGEHC